MSDITSLTLTELVKNIKDKKLSSEEVTKAFIDRSEKSKELNAYITEDYSSALEKANLTQQEIESIKGHPLLSQLQPENSDRIHQMMDESLNK